MARYDIRPDSVGWAVIDARTGEIARVNDAPQIGLELDDADDLADLLNRIDRQRPVRVN